jgi:HK97 family phage prohead protease
VRHDGGRLIGADAGYFGGLAAPTNVIAPVAEGYDECLLPGCFAASIRARPRVPITYAHNHSDLPVGMGDLEERTAGLFVTFRLGGSDKADRLVEWIERGWRPGLSIAFVPLKDRRTPASTRLAGRDLVERLEVDVREVAVCVVGAYTSAGISSGA